MTFELGKTYIVDVTENGIIPQEVFDRDRWCNKKYDDLDFLTYEEKTAVINDVLDKIKAEIMHEVNNHKKRITLYDINKYRAKSEVNADEDSN